MRRPRTVAALSAAALASVALAAAPASTSLAAAGPEPTWAPADSATIHPGVQVVTEGSQCTSNFIFIEAGTDPVTGDEVLEDVIIGMAAHCAGTDGNTATNGCDAGSRELGTPVDIDGASQPGTLVYSSWLAMQANDEADGDTCEANDLALVSIDPADWDAVNPSMPFWGGPTGLATTVPTATDLYSYGNSGLRAGITELSPKVETKVTETYGGWSHILYAVTPGIPGDSGSGHLTDTGEAFGVTSTIYLAPYAAGNGVTDLAKALAYARTDTGRDYRLVNGTEPFTPLS